MVHRDTKRYTGTDKFLSEEGTLYFIITIKKYKIYNFLLP